jgi:hypothetical protein
MGINDADEGEEDEPATPFRRRVLLAAAPAAADGDGIVMLTNGILNGREEARHEEDVVMTAMATLFLLGK